jgi:DNA-binding MarR family transcriptional regulator
MRHLTEWRQARHRGVITMSGRARAGAKTEPVDVGLRYLTLGYHLRRVVDDRMTAGGLSLARTKVLQALERRGPLRQTALAEELGHAPRSVTQSIEALERAGLVERTPVPGDRRSKLVTLTPAGTKALADGAAAGSAVLREIFGALDDEQVTELDRLLAAVEGAMGEVGAP